MSHFHQTIPTAATILYTQHAWATFARAEFPWTSQHLDSIFAEYLTPDFGLRSTRNNFDFLLLSCALLRALQL